jgi:hypothetical protein
MDTAALPKNNMEQFGSIAADNRSFFITIAYPIGTLPNTN